MAWLSTQSTYLWSSLGRGLGVAADGGGVLGGPGGPDGPAPGDGPVPAGGPAPSDELAWGADCAACAGAVVGTAWGVAADSVWDFLAAGAAGSLPPGMCSWPSTSIGVVPSLWAGGCCLTIVSGGTGGSRGRFVETV